MCARMRDAFGLLLVLALVSGCARPGAQLDTLWDAPQFNLTDQAGQPFANDALKGKVWMAAFIYTHCPDECPIYLMPKMKQLQDRILAGNDAGRAALVALTVDPRRDTPQVLADYGAHFAADSRVWHLLAGPDPTIQSLLQDGFKVGGAIPADRVLVTAGTSAPSATQGQAGAPTATPQTDQGGYLLLHTTRLVLVDQQDKIRQTYDGETVDVNTMWHDMQQLLGQG